MQAMIFTGPWQLGASFDVDVEYTLQALGPCHGGVRLGRGFCFPFEGPLAAFRLRDIGAASMAGGKDAVVAGKVDAGSPFCSELVARFLESVSRSLP